MNAIVTARLYYSEGSSDKEYHAEILALPDGNVVNFRYGRRGSTLTSGTKTATPVDLAQARKIFDKLIQSKTAKGYTPMSSGTPFQGLEASRQKSDFLPQLLNPVSEEAAQHLIANHDWAAQQKMDGERRAAHAENGSVIGINRKGLIVPLPQAIADELLTVAGNKAIRIDGEIIGDMLYVFDMHIHQGEPLHTLPWLQRMRLAQIALAPCHRIQTLTAAVTREDKHRLWQQVREANGEGIVFKRIDGPVTPGRPNSGGDWRKFKFTETASCCVIEANAGKRSVRIGLLEGNGFDDSRLIPVGNVTIPPNFEVPSSGDLIEVEYLYAYPGGSLYQPIYRGLRTDVDRSDCNMTQLKFKPSGLDADEDES
jgi:bifunctional non-homologous end joining protein LigD